MNSGSHAGTLNNAALFDCLSDERERGMQEHFPNSTEGTLQLPISELDSEGQSAMLRGLEMLPRANSTSYKERAAICAWCAKQTSSAETAVALLYLQQMWLLVAGVVEVIDGKGSGAPLSTTPHHLPLQQASHVPCNSRAQYVVVHVERSSIGLFEPPACHCI
jgi:hypothetical protein